MLFENNKLISMKKLIFVIILIIPLIYAGCKKKDDPVQLVASAGNSQTVKPLELVTLDGTASTGPEGFTYSWSYQGDVPESEIDFQNKNTVTPTFTPPKGEIYYFTLTTTSADQLSSDEVTVVASGGIEIGGTLSQDLALEDIEPDADVPDYIVTSDLIVPNGITLSVVDENVLVHFEPETGLHVTNGGLLSNTLQGNEEGLNIVFSGGESEGWKGIWIENSSINLNHATIENAGKQKFDELLEPASLILSGAQTNLISFDENAIKNSFSYSVMVPDEIGGEGFFTANRLSYKNPVKAQENKSN